MPGRLDNKMALITGGASGIGRATALRFAEEGADVMIADLNSDGGVVGEVQALGRRASFVRTDTSNAAQCEAMVAEAVRFLGRIDIVVAAAGISSAGLAPQPADGTPPSPTASFLVNKPIEVWEKVLSVNLNGVMYTDRFVAIAMMANGWEGSIINIASVAAKVPLLGGADYCVSKAGVWMLTKVLAMELGPHKIRVNAIGPGYIETPMTAASRADEVRLHRMLAATPMGRLGMPDEVANTALFLASDEASFFTGEILHPDGGMFAE